MYISIMVLNLDIYLEWINFYKWLLYNLVEVFVYWVNKYFEDFK